MNANINDTVEPTVSQKELYTGKYISLKVMTVEKHKGYCQREIVQHNGTLMIIPITEDNRIVIDKVYRKSIERYSYEIPTKTISSSENHIDLIREEILEKIGYEMLDVRHLFDFYPALSYSNEKVYVYVARVSKLKKVEFCNSFSVVDISLENVEEDTKDLDIIDAKTMIAINYIKENKDNLEV